MNSYYCTFTSHQAGEILSERNFYAADDFAATEQAIAIASDAHEMAVEDGVETQFNLYRVADDGDSIELGEWWVAAKD